MSWGQFWALLVGLGISRIPYVGWFLVVLMAIFGFVIWATGTVLWHLGRYAQDQYILERDLQAGVIVVPNDITPFTLWSRRVIAGTIALLFLFLITLVARG